MPFRGPHLVDTRLLNPMYPSCMLIFLKLVLGETSFSNLNYQVLLKRFLLFSDPDAIRVFEGYVCLSF